MLNAGHRKGATAGRCVIRGKNVETEELPAYCAVALAGLDDMPDTLMTRSVVVRMRRRAPNERVEPWRLRVNGAEAHELGDRLAEWARAQARPVAWPEMPPGIEDRNADVWEALLAVANLAGGEWPDRARRSAVTLVTQSADRTGSLGVILLRDLRTVFGEETRLSTDTILEQLHAIDESPWADLRGKELDARGLSRRLSKYGVKPKLLRVAEAVFRGYEAADLADPWSRYVTAGTDPLGELPATHNDEVTASPPSPVDPVTSVTPQQPTGCTLCRGLLDGAARLAGASTCTTCELKELSA